ncbi:MAG: diacylglycerol kinase [Cyclobacteriaceae bacterium]
MRNNFIKRIKSFFYAYRGFVFAFRTQANFRIQVFVAFLVMILGWFFDISIVEWTIIFLSIGVVISAELFNTAIEKILDFISPEYNEQAGMMKDIAAGAVLFSAIIAGVIGLIIFLPRIISFFYTI